MRDPLGARDCGGFIALNWLSRPERQRIFKRSLSLNPTSRTSWCVLLRILFSQDGVRTMEAMLRKHRLTNTSSKWARFNVSSSLALHWLLFPVDPLSRLHWGPQMSTCDETKFDRGILAIVICEFRLTVLRHTVGKEKFKLFNERLRHDNGCSDATYFASLTSASQQ